MPLHTVSLCATVAPTVVGTSIAHYVNRKPRRQKPTAHLSYDLGLNVVRKFIKNMANHSVDDVQAFTAQWVPAPTWVKIEAVEILQTFSDQAARLLLQQLGPKGILEVGGSKWWQWRSNNASLKAEWIEMRKDHQARGPQKSDRILFYIHGGAYYFGSVQEHRYQIQRHARKLKARAFAPRYRLAPQFPFPCGLHDCLTAYLFLLSEYDPKHILIAGDSAGGGMAASLLVLLRDQNIPLPAGAILLSPWVDLTHSFPSICGDGLLDYIPTQGFIHRPSVSWPPPRLEVVVDVPSNEIDHQLTAAANVFITESTNENTSVAHNEHIANKEDKECSQSPDSTASTEGKSESDHHNPPSTRPLWIPSHIPCHHVTPKVELNGKEIYIQEQIQLYASNFQLVNPLVSPALQPSLGGLCPLFIQVGSGELLSDEQIYFAHKAANPSAYPSNDEVMDRWDPDRTIVNKYPPTNVVLQVWDDLCHVPHTLAWTKPAKYMYRSVAQFGAWALARAQKVAIDIDNDELSSHASSDNRQDPSTPIHDDDGPTDIGSFVMVSHPASMDIPREETQSQHASPEMERLGVSIGKAGDALPPFVNHMIRQKVDRHGNVYALEAQSAFPCLQLKPQDVGVIKEAPVHRWLERQIKWEKRYHKLRANHHQKRIKVEASGLLPGMEGETPPPTALVRRWTGEKADRGRRRGAMDDLKKKRLSMGLKWWSEWGSKHDKETIMQQSAEDRTTVTTPTKGLSTDRPVSSQRRVSVVDEGQADHRAIHSDQPSPQQTGTEAHATPMGDYLDAPSNIKVAWNQDHKPDTSISASMMKETAVEKNAPESRPKADRFYSAKEKFESLDK